MAPITEAVSGMTFNTLLRKSARNARFWDFYSRVCQKFGRNRKRNWDLPTRHSLREAVFDPGWLLWTTAHLANC